MDWKFASPAWWYNNAMSYARIPECLKSALQTGRPGGFTRSKELRSSTLKLIARGSSWEPSVIRDCLMLNALLAKWRLYSDESGLPTPSDRRMKALEGFYQRNSEAADYGAIPYPYGFWMRKVLAAWLPCVDAWDEETRQLITGRFGPGACCERLSHFKRFHLLRDWVNRGDAWPEVGLEDGSQSGCMQHATARLCAVPKDVHKDRLITVEPAYGTFAQQYVRSLLLRSIHTGPLRGSVWDVEHVDAPAIQRQLALKASLKKDLATVDLSDASDHITWSAVKQVFPSWVTALLEVTRSEFYDSDAIGAEHIPLHIYAGMGNATTFTVESLFFGAAVKAICIAHGLHDRRVTVFGDDIVCSCSVLPFLENMSPFMKVNWMKTFTGDESLRESCGIFAYQGFDVTYPDFRGYSPDWEGRLAVADLYTRLKLQFGFDTLAEAIKRENSLLCLPAYVPGYPAIWSGDTTMPPSIPQRINKDYQCLELKLPVEEPRTQFIPSSDTGARLLGYPSGSGEALYLANQCGMLRLIGRQSRRQVEYGYSFPVGRRRVKLRWVTPQPLPDL